MRRIALKAVVAFAGFIFSVSVFLPFQSARVFSTIPEIKYQTLMFWSFQATNSGVERFSSITMWTETFRFVDYWSILRVGWGVPAGLIILMFIAQLLSILSSIGVVLLRRPASFWFLLPGIYGGVTVLSMVFFAAATKTLRGFVMSVNLEAGFWLAIASTALFLASFLLSAQYGFRKKRVPLPGLPEGE